MAHDATSADDRQTAPQLSATLEARLVAFGRPFWRHSPGSLTCSSCARCSRRCARSFVGVIARTACS
jgi:hypothetical protein